MSRFAKLVVVLACLVTFIGILNTIPQVAHAASRPHSIPVVSISAIPSDAYVVVEVFDSQNFGSVAIRRGYQGSTLGTGFGVRHIEYEHPPLDYTVMAYVLNYGHVTGTYPNESEIIECKYGNQNYRLILSYQDTEDGLGLGVVTMFKI